MISSIFVSTITVHLWWYILLCIIGIPVLVVIVLIPIVLLFTLLADKVEDIELKRHNKSRGD